MAGRYTAELPPRPTGPDRDLARAYLARIDALLVAGPLSAPGEAATWTRVERKDLQRLRRKWTRRCAGRDARWSIVGTRNGRLPSDLEAQLRPAPSPAWTGETPRR